MLRLILLRHAKTEAQAASGQDFDRALDSRGQSDAADVGTWLAAQPRRPDNVLVSPALRARQTWTIVSRALDPPPPAVFADALYTATTPDLLQIIRDHGDTAHTLMIIAHNPSLHELALALCHGGDADALQRLRGNLPTAALVSISFDDANWGDIGFRRGFCDAFVSPKSLRDET